LLFCLVLFAQTVLSAKYLVLHADEDPYIADVQEKLTAILKNVDVISVRYENPNKTALAGYDSILVYSNYAFGDNAGLGDLLADAVDRGQGVVTAVFALTTFFDSSYLGGRFAPDSSDFDNSYYAIAPGPRAYSPDLTIKVIEKSHPVLTGVSSFDGGAYSFRGTGSWVKGAEQIATWSDGTTPLIAARTIKGNRRVDLNYFPASSDVATGFWVSSTDGAKIIANSLVWVANKDSASRNLAKPASQINIA